MAASLCWSGDFSFATCCLGGVACWADGFNFESCCLSHPVLSSADIAKASSTDHWSCGCEAGDASVWKRTLGFSSTSDASWDWCLPRKAMMLNWDMRKSYSDFVQLSVDAVADCPLGAFHFMVMLTMWSVSQGKIIQSLPSYYWAEEMFSLLVRSHKSFLVPWTESGWNPFFILSQLRGLLSGSQGPPCDSNSEHTESFLVDLDIAVRGGVSVPAARSIQFLSSLSGADACTSSSKTPGTCCLPRALATIALADGAAVRGHHDEWASLLQLAEQQIQASTSRSENGALMNLLVSRWPVVDILDKIFQIPIVNLSVAYPIKTALKLEIAGPFSENADATFRMHVFPHREMVSDMVRYSRLPFCGMRPFMMLIERISRSQECKPPCHVTFVEGGPHVGDCTLWATAALEVAGVQSYAVAYEALSDAAGLFRKTVLANSWDGRIVVVPNALADSNEGFTKVVHHPGHNGEATLARIFSSCSGCVGHGAIPRVNLDSSWPVFRSGAMEILKLSVNGEELNTMRGARTLLSKRKICSVMMHVTKVVTGWEAQEVGKKREDFSSELWQLLDSGGMNVGHHLDADVTGQVHGDPRSRPSTKLLKSADELDAVFRAPYFAHDYLIAAQRQSVVDAGSPCQGSFVLKHFDEMFGFKP